MASKKHAKHVWLTVKAPKGFRPKTLLEIRPDLCPEILRPAGKPIPFDVSYISETDTTITIRHRDGEILTVKKATHAEVAKRLKRAKRGRGKAAVDTGGSLR